MIPPEVSVEILGEPLTEPKGVDITTIRVSDDPYWAVRQLLNRCRWLIIVKDGRRYERSKPSSHAWIHRAL